ncbi:PepSY domain-containing protein [Hyphobacterium sp. HN65]|uniref:PepSY domain-containing protein n=1 Tax=Hyphobacterium lacteum TaxID=3116575 RepID=A0ABU7LT30_9PROT|nr:PepSY domain-containing protein [Hyphobacterium sp. HN65]MEE2527059.1 PepSY domain-containing protein [Hyphobacterium sp. HN65]
MNRRDVIRAGFAGAIIAASAISGPVAAATTQNMQNRLSSGQARDARDSGDVLPALRVISIVRSRYPGADVLDAELERGGSPRYIIKILTREGRRIDVVVDARTGQILYER